MDRDNIIKMAKEAGLLPIDIGPTIETWQMRRKEESLVRFAELVAAHEREACAKVCEERQEVFQKYYTKGLAAMCAEAIRARGEQ